MQMLSFKAFPLSVVSQNRQCWYLALDQDFVAQDLCANSVEHGFCLQLTLETALPSATQISGSLWVAGITMVELPRWVTLVAYSILWSLRDTINRTQPVSYVLDWLPREGTKIVLLNYYQTCPMATRASLGFITKQHVYPICKIICECPKVFCSVFKFVVFWLRGHSISSAKEIRLT